MIISVELFSHMAKLIERQAKELTALRPLSLEAATLLLSLVSNPNNRPTAVAQQIREAVGYDE